MSAGACFIGSYKHTLDPKGRVFIPKKFLDALPQDEPRHFIVTRGFDGCLTLYVSSSWKAAVAKMKDRARGVKETRDFRRLIFASARQCPIDGSGRILLPEELRSSAGMKRDVVFVGLDDEIELWDHEAWKEYYAEVSPHFEDAGQEVL